MFTPLDPPMETLAAEVVVVGAGAAGLATALNLAPRRVVVLALGPAATGWAQGGIAAATGPDDSPALHAADTEAAGAGLVDPLVAALVTAAAPGCIDWLQAAGVVFDPGADGRPARGLEAAHGRARILHAGGDATGRAILAALTARAGASPHIHRLDSAEATALLTDARGQIAGITVDLAGRRLMIRAAAIVLATGGIGGLYAHSTNPPGAVGRGLALAARIGARLRDLEFVQFHPTAMDLGSDPMPLASEAIRGAGAVLIDGAGQPVMAGIPGGDLAPRDVVARQVAAAIDAGGRVFLDARAAIGPGFTDHFPSAAAACMKAGVDPARQPIPVAPAAHYHMGGIAVDLAGRTSIPGLWAAGEVAATGLHGANRLASNSLLEALVCGSWVARDILAASPDARAPVIRPTLRGPSADSGDSAAAVRHLRVAMSRQAGVLRDAPGLDHLIGLTAAIEADPKQPAAIADRALVCRLIAEAARDRPDSVGAHRRTDTAPLASREIRHVHA